MVMMLLHLLSIEHICTTQDCLKSCDQQLLLLEGMDLHLMMEVHLAVLLS